MLYFTGRLGELIKTGGANVTPSEVEAVLVAQPEVSGGLRGGRPRRRARRGRRGGAWCSRQARASSTEALRARLRRELAAYKVPRLVHFAAPGSLPFTDSGKIDKRRLRALLGGQA